MAWYDWLLSEVPFSMLDLIRGSALFAMLVLLFILFERYLNMRMRVRRREMVFMEREFIQRSRDARSQIIEQSPTGKPRLEFNDMRKKVDFLRGPRLFYFLDTTVIDSLYSQIRPAYKTTYIETESLTETEKSMHATLPILTPSYGKKDVEVEKKKIELIETSEIKYDVVLKYLFDNNRINLGIGDFVNNNIKENEFIENCNELEEKFDFKIPENVISEYIKDNQKILFEEGLEKLSKITDYVMIKGEFIVINTVEKDWKLTYMHPINNIKNTDVYKEDVSIDIICSHNNMNEIGNDSFKKTSSISLSIFGNVINYDDKILTLNIRPIAIH